MTLLDILTVLPDECGNHKTCARRIVRKRAGEAFSIDTENVLGILKEYIRSAGSKTNLQFKVFRCFLSWVRYGDISPQRLADDPLFKYTFQAVEKPALFEIAVEVLSELVLHTQDMKRYQPAVAVLVPNILKLGPKFDEALRDGDDETCRNLARLFVDVGEVYTPLFLKPNRQAQIVVELMLKCSAHPDKNIASMPFNFWWKLSRALCDRSFPRKIKEQFERPFITLIGSLKKVMQYPPSLRDFKDNQAISDCKRMRYIAADALVDTVSVVGVQRVLRILYTEMMKEWERYKQNKENWRGVEACLYCFRSLARRVSNEENEVLPKLMQFILVKEVQEQFALRYTATLIVGRFHEWIRHHPRFIEPLLKFVVTGLGSKLRLVVSSAAFAFNYVCTGCANQLAKSYILDLFKVYKVSGHLPLRERKEIVEGLTSVVTRLPLQNENGYLKGLTEMMKPLAEILKGAIDRKMLHVEPHKTKISDALDLVAQIFMSITEASEDRIDEDQKSKTQRRKHTVFILSHLKPILDTLMLQYLKDDSLMERVCRCWKYGIRAVKLGFTHMLKPLLNRLAELFPEHPHSSFLYIICVCVSEFGKQPHREYQEVMAKAYVVFTKHGMNTLRNSKAFTDNPDVVGDFFDMQKRYLTHCPRIVFSSELIVQVFQCALVGIGVHHEDACAMLMRFFATFIRMGSELRNEAQSRKSNEGIVKATNMLKQIMKHFGEAMTAGLLQGAAGRLPNSRIQFVAEVIEELIKHCPEPARIWITTALRKIPETEHPTHGEFVEALFRRRDFSTHSAANLFTKQIKEAIRDFSSAARVHLR
eukprot:CAMPEP_0167747030 /NCGR_PEP_ID=MMETSP0110_2-20121227/4047_1 /TAXON_ID=629695 /ORGANISM="Gymnochlora sp., Strain CCMP2014" /LENGTH=817 /DNA_ID=CAMNT_0007631871 /DNA_START=450 /DNA_END=2903 /DNA_ORIENTATION=+